MWDVFARDGLWSIPRSMSSYELTILWISTLPESNVLNHLVVNDFAMTSDDVWSEVTQTRSLAKHCWEVATLCLYIKFTCKYFLLASARWIFIVNLTFTLLSCNAGQCLVRVRFMYVESNVVLGPFSCILGILYIGIKLGTNVFLRFTLEGIRGSVDS